MLKSRIKLTQLWIVLLISIGWSTTITAQGLDLPYYDAYSGNAEEYAFKISNTYPGAGVSYGGFFYAKSGQGRGIFGQAEGASGIGVKGWAKDSGNVLNYGGRFCATGQQGVGVYGWAENTGNVINYGGKFLAEGARGVGIQAKGGANGFAGIFEGDIKIVGTGKGIIFPDGTKQTTAGGGTSTSTTGGGWIISGNNMYSTVSGGVGIGTNSPAAALDVQGSSVEQLVVRNKAIPGKYLYEGVDSSGYAHIGAWNRSTNAPFNLVLQGTGGNVGIGTTAPNAKLEVAGSVKGVAGTANAKNGVGVAGYVTYTGAQGNEDDVADNYAGHFVAEGKTWYQGSGVIREGWRTNSGVGIYAKGGNLAAYLDGRVEINGNTSVWGQLLIKDSSTGSTLINLGKGLDYAEGFNVTNMKEVNPGSVLIIDVNNPGNLMLSTSAYDTKVAGIVAGAKGLGSGVRLGTGESDHDVALAGRVYCNVDATHEAVQPGDLLTTSTTLGYAMKVLDHVRAQGAILGKAMENLEQGSKGQILVLVTLQ